MSTEALTKSESYSRWFICVGFLLLLAVAIPVGLKLFGRREVAVEMRGDPGGKIKWSRETADGVVSGRTNLPVKFVFHAHATDFMATRGVYAGPLEMTVFVNGISCGKVSSAGLTNGGLRFQMNGSDWGYSGTP